MLRFHPLRITALLAAVLLIPASAQAAQITGDPLSVSSADEDGRLGASFTGSGTTEFYHSSVDTETGTIGPANAGFVVATVNAAGEFVQYGSRRGNVTRTSAPVVTGSGSAADPFRIVQTFTGGPVDIRQEITYVNGQISFRAKLDVRNVGNEPLEVRASMGADLAGGGSDSGTGVLEGGPPRFVGGFNTTVGSVTGLSELTPWSHYEEGPYSAVLDRADSNPRTGERLQDRIEPTEVDNGAAVQWDGTELASGAGAEFEVAWRFTRTFDVSPAQQNLTTGDPARFTVSTQSTDGRPQANVPVRFTVFGANNASGDARTGDNGEATLEYLGANPGGDSVTIYADLNDNGQRDDDEPQRQATVEWTGLEAPAFAKEVNVRPVAGRVLVRLPRNAKVSGKLNAAARFRFVRLKSQTRIPVGAELEALRGTVQLTSAASAGGGVQTAQFYSGRFKVAQKLRGRGVTDLLMTGPLKCSTTARRGKVTTSASRRSRRLWGRGRGRFRTRGRHSTATVRGTTWLTKDNCNSTTTVVREGTVVVRDFAKRRNVTLKAPRRYTARARKR